MLKKTYTAALAASAIALSAGAASAVTFDFAGSTTLDGTDQVAVGGIGVTAFAGKYSDAVIAEFIAGESSLDFIKNVDSPYRDVSQNPGTGLGVDAPWTLGDDSLVDGGGNELLTLDFDIEVFVSEVVFSHWDDGDSFDLFVDGDLVKPEERQADGSGVFDLAALGLGKISSISFGADAIGCCSSDEFGIASLSAQVPLPAAGWMLLAGLGGLAAMKRRKKADA
jgi:hypothetical protein